MPVQVAVPLTVGTNSAQLYIQRPHVGLIDGVEVCVCPRVCAVCEGSCGYTCDWYPLPAGVHIITLHGLSPGSDYQLVVYSTSQGQMGPPFYTHPVRTGDCTYSCTILSVSQQKCLLLEGFSINIRAYIHVIDLTTCGFINNLPPFIITVMIHILLF